MTLKETEITITGTFVKVDESDVLVSVGLDGSATFCGVDGNYTVQGIGFSIEEHIKQGE